MLNLSRRAVLTGGALLGTVAIALPTMAAGSGTPANKAIAAGATLSEITPEASGTPILSAKLKTSKPTDLILQVALECSILTDVVITGGPEVESATSSAQADIKIWVELDGKIVPITSTSTPPQEPAAVQGGEEDKVTFCDRVHMRTVTDAEDGNDGIDSSRDYQLTKAANAFNWLRLNAGSGEHTVVVKAALDTENTEGSTATGYVGNRSIVIEPTKLANDAVIAENASS